jgi:iron complex outermembrane recepter protein
MANPLLRLRRNLIVSTCLAASGLVLQTAAHAETASSGAAAAAASTNEVEQIVVTAERRTTDIQRTPLAITAVTSQSLDKSFTNELSGLNAVVPSLEITKTSGFENIVTIRGVGSETPENAPTTVPGVSVFIDGVYIANTVALDQTLFDVDHIEVLRGPQGALFGQSSIGGAISILTKQPQLHEFSGSGDVSFGDYSLSRERAEINIPLGDQFALRASAQKYDHDGFTKDVAIPGFTLDDAHDASGKAALLWKPTDTFSATLGAEIYHSSQHGAAQKNINDPESSVRSVYQDYPSHFGLSSQLYHLNLQWDLPWFTIKSVSAYQGLQQNQHEDSSRSAYSILGSYDDVAAWNTKLKNYNEEFDIVSRPGGKLDWTVGAFALSQVSDQFVAEFEGTDANPDLTVKPDISTNPPSNLAYGNLTHVNRKSYSGFFQGTYHITSALRLTAGARINYDSYDMSSNNFSEYGISQVNHTYNDTVPTWRAELDYDVAPDNMLYASVARGYKPGGLNGKNGQNVVPESFEPETNTAFQVGSKNMFFDRSLRLNVDAFYYVYKDMQYIETDPVPFDGGMDNIPSVHIYGVEAEASYVGMDSRLRVNANLAVENGQVQGSYKTIDSTVANSIETTNAACTQPSYYPGKYWNSTCWAAVVAAARDIGGKTPPAMPKVSGSINLSYRFDVPNGALTPRVEVVYRGAEWARIFNEPSLDRVPAYTVTNLNLEYVPTGSRFRLSVAATNVFNVNGVNSRYTDPYGTGQTSQQYIPPRQVIGTVAYSF